MIVKADTIIEFVIFSFFEGKLQLLLVSDSRTNDYCNQNAQLNLPKTVHINPVDFDETARNFTSSLTKIHDILVEQVYSSIVNSSSNIYSISVTYMILLNNQHLDFNVINKECMWIPVSKVPEEILSSKKIVKALNKLNEKALLEPVLFNLLPEKFTLSQLQNIYEIIFNAKYDKRNFHKKMTNKRYIIPLDEKQQKVPHKPAQLYFFSKEVFKKFQKKQLSQLI